MKTGKSIPKNFKPGPSLRKEAAKGLAERADTNGDGAVDDEERQNAIDNIRAKIIEKRCELFDAVNGDDDVLTLDEFTAIGPVGSLPDEDCSPPLRSPRCRW